MIEQINNQKQLFEIYENLIENTRTHLAYLDKDFNFIRVNSAYANGSGHTKEELIGHNHFDLFPNEENQRLFEQARDTGQSIEYKAKPFEYADQPWRGVTYWDWTLIPIKNDAGEVQGLVLSLIDVTELQKAVRFIDASISSIAKSPSLSSQQELRQSGIEVIGAIPWGTHFCQFYAASQDLIETLVPYFREGLRANEFCMWITSPPLQVEQAMASLQAEIPDLNEYLAKGQIEIMDYNRWYTSTGRFDADTVLQGWINKLATARGQGYEGLRLTGNTFWLEQATWKDFTRYEVEINRVIGGERMLALCTYSLEKCGIREIMDVIGNHQFALIKHIGRWEIIESNEHMKTEQALRESEERLRLSIWAADLGVFEWEMLTGRAVWENQRMYGIFGLNPQDSPLGKAQLLERAIHPDDAALFVAALEEGMKPGRLFHTICRIYRQNDGKLRWIEFSGRFDWDAAGVPVRLRGVVADITERKQAETALRMKQEELAAANEELQVQQEELIALNKELQAQQEELYTTYRELQRQAAELDAAISSIAAGAIIYDHSGNISRMNEFARNLLKDSSQDYNAPYQESRTSLNLYKSDGTLYETEETPLFRALHGEIIRDEEMIIARNSEDPIWLSGTLAPIYDRQKVLIGVIFIFTDITERKRRVEDLLASERELLKVTLNSLGEGVVAADQEERIMLINEAAVNLTGYSQEEAIGAQLSKILYVFDDQTSEPLNVTVCSKKSGSPILVTRDLLEVPIAMNSSPIKATDGRIIGTVIVFQDISEKQRTERELLKADKLESLGILAGGIAHDFNNILAAILSNIQLAMIKLKKNEDIKMYLFKTAETARKASDLTKQLLTFSKGGAPVKKDASLVELIKDTTEFVLRGAKTKAEFAIPDDLWPASIDEGQISQVLHNLVLNAKQAMPKGGIIRISAENVVIEEEHRFSKGNYIKIIVKDQGIGIAKESLSKIFDPFFTTKKDGNGLGLATSYSIITRHNGYIEVESKEGAGTSFIIHLPAANTMTVPVESRKEVAAAGSGFKILLMDDEESILNTVGEILKCYGYQVALTTDGTEALELYKQAKRLGEPFDAVIMDLTIPGGMGGQEAIAYLRDFDPKIKAIVSSGYSNDPIMADYERFGFIGVVSKPYKIDELNEVLRKVLNTEQLSLELGY